MKITEIKINYGRTVNLGNYESARLDVELSATMDQGDNPANVAEQLRADAKLQINKWINLELRGKNNAKQEDDIPW